MADDVGYGSVQTVAGNTIVGNRPRKSMKERPVVILDPFLKKGKLRYAVALMRNGVFGDEFYAKVMPPPAFYFSDGELDLAKVEKNIRFDMSIAWFVRSADWKGDEFDGLRIRQYDGHGDVVQSWVLCGVKVRSIVDDDWNGEGDCPSGHHNFIVDVTYGLPIRHQVFKEFA